MENLSLVHAIDMMRRKHFENLVILIHPSGKKIALPNHEHIWILETKCDSYILSCSFPSAFIDCTVFTSNSQPECTYIYTHTHTFCQEIFRGDGKGKDKGEKEQQMKSLYIHSVISISKCLTVVELSIFVNRLQTNDFH